MKIIIQKKRLQEALQKLSKATPAKATIPILNCVLFSTQKSALTLRTTDLQLSMITSISAQIEEHGSIAIPYKPLMDITAAMPDTNLTFVANGENKVNIRTEFGNYDVIGVDADEFPSPPEENNNKEITIKAEILGRLIEKTVFALSNDELKPALMGTLFQFGEDGVTAVATDGHRLAICSRNDYVSKGYIGEVVVPKKFLLLISQYLDDDSDVILRTGSKNIAVTFNGLMIVSQIISERYPDYSSVVPQENDKEAKVNREQLIASVRRVSIFSNKTTKQIALQLSVGGSIISTEDPESASSAKENIDMEYSEEDLVIGYNAQYLNEILFHLDTESVVFKLKTPISAGLILPEKQKDNEQLTMLIMPMRINDS